MIFIIIPVYNVEKYLHRCIDSILAQTYDEFELVLVDDGSPDKCGYICDEYAMKDKRITVIHKKNGGLASARNAGLEYVFSKSELHINDFIGFVDSDDVIAPNMYECLHSMYQLSIDLAMCAHETVKEGQKCCVYSANREYNKVLLNENELWEEVFGNLNNAVWNKLYRAEFMKDIRFMEGIIHGEDLIFNLQYLLKCKNGAMIDAKCYYYIKRTGSITSSIFSDRRLMEIEAKERAKEIIIEHRPEQILNAKKHCFRARLNVIRSIVKARVEVQNIDILEQCREYVRDNYRTVRSKIKFKEKIEYFLYIYAKNMYRWVICKFF